MMLRHHVHFVHGAFDHEWTDVGTEAGRGLSLDALAPRLKLGREIWIVQAFQVLRERGHHVSFSGSLRPGVINVVHADDYPWTAAPWRVFVVAVRADRDPVFGAALEIVQNAWSRWRSSDVFVPHWPQPGLLPRDERREDRLETLVYKGKEDNLALSFRSDDFRAALGALGMRLVVDDQDWWDYRGADVVLAVRGGNATYLNIKPASKLVNAWMAGCPAILSDEAGYLELRQSELDYFPAETTSDVLGAVRTLRERPDLRSAMARHGRRRAEAFSVDAVADRWEAALSGPIAERFERWSRAGPFVRACRGPMHLAQRLRKRVWGYQVVQPEPSKPRRRVNALRRAITLPGAPRE